MTTVEATDNRNALTFETCKTLVSSKTSISDLQLVQTLQTENSNLKLSLNKYKRKLNNRSSLLSKYKKQVKILKRKLKLQSEKLTDQNSEVTMNKICSQFIRSQYRLMMRHKKGRRYENSDKEFALALYYCSTKSYMLLQKFFCLPSINSLRSWLNNLHVECDINLSVLQLLKIKSEKLRREEKIISLIFDEMSLQEHLNYDARTDIFEGFEDFGNNRPLSSHQLCNQAMAVMIKGLYLDFKQIIGYFLSKEAMVANNFKDILLLEIIEKVSQTGFLIKTTVCDLGSNNVKLRRLLSVTVTDPYITYNEEKIFFPL